MRKFRAKSDIVLGVLLLISVLAFVSVENSKLEVKKEWYQEKLEASKQTQAAFNCIKAHRLEKGIYIDNINDPNETSLIGQKYTHITTDRGDINAKLTSTNPNMAAIIVKYLKDAGVETGDFVAVGMTGSFPAINIATISAMEVLELKPIVISSIGASNFGANDPDFTWLDMETLLNDKDIIKTKSVAASIGGGDDIGRGLSPKGRELIFDAISRNGIPVINKGTLIENINERMKIYREHTGTQAIKAYINIGGGVASLGHSVNGDLINSGLTLDFKSQNYPIPGVIVRMGEKGTPIINLVNIDRIAKRFGLPVTPNPNPLPGDGQIYTQTKYNLWVVTISTLILAALIAFIYISDKKFYTLGTDEVPSKVPVSREEHEYVNEI